MEDCTPYCERIWVRIWFWLEISDRPLTLARPSTKDLMVLDSIRRIKRMVVEMECIGCDAEQRGLSPFCVRSIP